MPLVAYGSRTQLVYCKENVHGQTPSGATMARLRHTGCSIDITRDSFTSEELRPDRQISDMRTGANKIAGTIDIELSFGEYDPLFEAVFAGTWADNTLKCGAVETSFTIEHGFTDINQYEQNLGCYMNKFSMSLAPNAMATASFDVVGLSQTTSTASIATSPTASKTFAPMDTFTGSLKEGGVEIATVTGLDLELDNGIDSDFVLFAKNPPLAHYGKSNVSGSMTCFFVDMQMKNKFLNETESQLEITMTDRAGNSYTFKIPRLLYSASGHNIDGDGLVSENLSWQALFDATTGTNLILTRTPAGSGD